MKQSPIKRILLNYIYYSPVGHTVEALRYAKGLYKANPGYEIHVALNDRSTPILTEGCSWIAQVYPIHLDDFENPTVGAEVLQHVPKEWDYIVDNNLVLLELGNPDELGRGEGTAAKELGWEEQAMQSYFQLTNATLTAKSGRGTLYPAINLPKGLYYKAQSQVILSVPVESQEFAKRYAHDGPKICIMLGGSAGYRVYPDVSSWIKIITTLSKALPAAKFYLTGVHKSTSKQTHTAAYSDEAIQAILASNPDMVDCYDIGPWNQIALIKNCDILISPHTGFAFLASCVGTPWLAISGGNWPEYFFNNVPFYSVLPDNPNYPYKGAIDTEGDSPKIPCMQPQNLDKKIPEIVEATQLLMNPAFTYEKALQRHRENINRANIKREHIPTTSSF